MDEQDIEIEEEWNQWDDMVHDMNLAMSGNHPWQEAIDHAAQEICDWVDEQVLNELLEEWHQDCITNYEAAMRVVTDDV